MILTPKKRFSKKGILITSTVIVVAATVSGGYWYIHKNDQGDASSTQTVNLDKPTTEQKKAGQAAKDATVKGTTQDTGNLETGETQQSSDGTSTPQVAITAANQNGDTVQIRTLIPSVTTVGTCALVLKNGSYSVNQTANVQALADSATCQGFDVPTSQLPVKGTWVATVTYTDTSGSTQATQNIIIK